MSVDVLPPTGSLADPYLVQVGKALQPYWNGVHEKKLILQRPNPSPLPMGYPVLLIRNIPANVSVQVQVNLHIEVHSPPENQTPTPEASLGIAEAVSVYNHKLQHAVALKLKAIKELKHKDSTLPRKITKLTALKKNLEEFTKVIDKILSFYSAGSMGFHVNNCPTLDDLSLVEEKVSTLLSYLKFEELAPLLQQYNDQCMYTNENILCTILGLREELGDWLSKMDDDMKMHQDMMYHFRSMIENEENLMKADRIFKETGKEGLKKKLRRVGFTAETAEMITDSIPDDLVDLQLPSFWAMRYLEFVFHHHPLLSDVPNYPYNKDVENRWFEQQIPVVTRPEPEESEAFVKGQWSVKMMNITSPTGQGNTLAEEFLREQENDTQYKLMYHGTTHRSAVAIVQNGINLTLGKDGQDFSSSDGFYLSESFEIARKWMRAGKGEKCQAVIVFKVKHDLLDPDKQHGLDVTNDPAKWDQIVRLCRKCYENLLLKRKLLRDIRFIRGPMCLNPEAARIGAPLLGFGGRGKKMQFCIRDEDYAWELGSLVNICCVLFYYLS